METKSDSNIFVICYLHVHFLGFTSTRIDPPGEKRPTSPISSMSSAIELTTASPPRSGFFAVKCNPAPILVEPREASKHPVALVDVQENNRSVGDGDVCDSMAAHPPKSPFPIDNSPVLGILAAEDCILEMQPPLDKTVMAVSLPHGSACAERSPLPPLLTSPPKEPVHNKRIPLPNLASDRTQHPPVNDTKKLWSRRGESTK
jgi:hypothetical protein